MKNLNASEGDSSGEILPQAPVVQNGNGNSNSKTVETSKLESRTTGTSTNTELTNESVVSELKVIMKNRGLTFTEEEFEAFIATERGNHLLQNIKLTMEKDKLKLQNEEQQQALVQTNENAPNQHVAALKDLLESRGMYLSDDELQNFKNSEVKSC